MIPLIAGLPRQYEIPFRSRQRIETLRDRNLRSTVRYAFETVPYYQRQADQLGIHQNAIQTLDDLEQLPIVTGDLVRRDPLDFVSDQIPGKNRHPFKSGGSQGVEKTVYHDTDSLLMNIVLSERQEIVYRSFVRHALRYRRCNIQAPESTKHKIQKVYRHLLSPLQLLKPKDLHLSLGVPFLEKVASINRFRPHIIRGYPRAIGELYDRAKREHVSIHLPKLMVMGGESLPTYMRETITEHFGVPILMSYQSNEALKIAYECKHTNGYHLHEDLTIVRIVDEQGQPVPNGQVGRVIITNLVNRATVLINYDLADTGRINPELCPCGRTFYRIELEKTRDVPLLKTLDGRVIHPAEIILLLDHHAEIDMAQVIIEKPDLWRIGVITKDQDATRRWLKETQKKIQREIAGKAVRVQLDIFHYPEQSKAGKTLQVIINCWGEHPYV